LLDRGGRITARGLNGPPIPWPPVFLERYIVIDEVANAYPALAPI
jgi:hypothetical protein